MVALTGGFACAVVIVSAASLLLLEWTRVWSTRRGGLHDASAAESGKSRWFGHLAASSKSRKQVSVLATSVGVSELIRNDTYSLAGAAAARSVCGSPRVFAQSPWLPWRLYDAFVSREDGCRLATFVAQYEGGCDEMEGVLESAAREAGEANASAWLEGARAEEGACASCVLHKWEMANRPRFDRARRQRVQRAGGPTKELRCLFSLKGGHQEAVPVEARPIDRRFHMGLSTLVFECEVPLRLARSACGGHRDAAPPPQGSLLQAAIEAEGGRRHAAVELCVFDARRSAENDDDKVPVAACTWTSAEPYRDRDGKSKRATTVAALTEWLAAHSAFGVGYFLVFDDGANWTDPRESALWAAIAPLAARGRAALLPWPAPACGAKPGKDSSGPWVALRGGQRSALSMQSFWGRPTQYASQNACHRRLRPVAHWIAHLDVDEFAVPALDSLGAALAAVARRAGADPDNNPGAVASVALPHIFYAECPSAAATAPAERGGGGEAPFFLARPSLCAGKAQPSRTKQIASSTGVDCVLDHVAKIKHGPVVTAIAGREARLVHARAGYAFDGPAAARFASVQREDAVPAAERRNFRTHILPRLATLDCDQAAADGHDTLCSAPSRDLTARSSTSPGGGGGGATAASGDPFCWCRDASIRDTWLPRIQAHHRRFWGPDSATPR